MLRFQVLAAFLGAHDIHTVGSAEHREYWIPAEDLVRFNESIASMIEVVSEFHGV